MSGQWLSDEQQRIWRSYIAIEHRLPSRLGRELQATSGLSGPEYEVLVNLSETPGERLRPYQLGERMEWEQSRLSHQLSRMERRGLVAREECAGDGRGSFVVLTAAGRAAIEAAAPSHVDMVRKLVFDQLTPEEAAAFGQVCDKILRAIADTASSCAVSDARDVSASGDAPDSPERGRVAQRIPVDE